MTDDDDWLVVRITPEAAQAITDAIVGRHPTWRELMLAMRRARTGRPNPYAKRERNAAVMQLHEQGMSIKDLARRFDVSPARVHAIIKQQEDCKNGPNS